LIYNNTIAGISGAFNTGGNILVNGGSGNICRNNLGYDIAGTFSVTCSTTSSNGEESSDPFVNYATGNLHLSTGIAGTTIATPYDTDMDGVTRGGDGTWDRGAYEYGGADFTPAAFSFTDNVNVPVNTVIYSDSIEVADIDDDTSIDISGAGCEYQVNGTGGWLTSGDNVVLGNTVALRVPSAPTYSTDRACTLTLGESVSDTWHATTIAAAAVDYVPIPPRMRAHLRQSPTGYTPPADPGYVGHIAPTAAQSISESPYSNNGWNSPEFIYSSGEASITAATFGTGDLSYVLKGYSFNFSAIPDGATIDGVEVIINARHGSDALPVTISLAQLLDTSRVKVGTNQYSSPQTLTTSAADYTVGGAADLWGNALTPAWVKDADFGVALGFTAGGNKAKVYVDSVTMKVWYTP
jgi:hypothetical protein